MPQVQSAVAVLGGLSRLVDRVRGDGRGPSRDLLADSIHGKVVSPEAAEQLVTIREDIDLRNLEQVIPFSQARDIVIRNPEHIVALDCPCRASRADPCLPLDVCIVVGEPFASMFSQHQPDRARWISQEEAVGILRAEHERGHVHHAFFKKAMLGRFYAICNCCACCCGPMVYWQHGTPMLASSGYVCQADTDQCTGCGACVATCQFAALELRDGTIDVDQARCLGCGVCVSKCRAGALMLVRDPSRGAPLEIRTLIAG